MMRRSHTNYYTIIFVIILILLCTLFLEEKMGSRIVTIITVSTAIIGATSVFVQYKRDKDVNQASFILEYAKYFHSLNGVEETMQYLDEYREGKKDALKKISYNGIVNYLVWCEELSALCQKNVLDIETIDNLFSYTFFLITNNKYVQEIELCPQAEYYKGVFFLHEIWTEYKKDTGQPILNEEESLEKVDNYHELAEKGDMLNTNRY